MKIKIPKIYILIINEFQIIIVLLISFIYMKIIFLLVAMILQFKFIVLKILNINLN